MRIAPIIYCGCISLLSVVVKSYTQDALDDQILSLPRSTHLLSHQFSGFLQISSTKNIHYMYYESENDPANDPVVFWTNGGPGCSGLLGLYTEFGPWRPVQNGSLVSNPWSWTKLANLVFLEQPVGVGFSYGTDEDELSAYNDYRASVDNLHIIKTFFTKFPERNSQPFYVASESYGGHYIPQWTLQLFNDAHLRSLFKGMLLGNPYTSYPSLTIGMANVMWGLQMIPQPIWDDFTSQGCDSLDSSFLDLFQLKPQCLLMFDHLADFAGPVNPYALDFPVCVADLNNTSLLFGDDDDGDGIDDPKSLKKRSSRRTTQRSFELGLSHQARTLLKIHQKVKESAEYKENMEKYAANNPEYSQMMKKFVDTLNKDEAIVDVSGRSFVSAPSKRRRQRNKRLLGETAAAAEFQNIPYDPCTADYTREYLNDPEVQAALHVLRPNPSNPSEMVGVDWSQCNDAIFEVWTYSDFIADTTDLYNTLYGHENKPDGFKMLVFSGDSDGVCATVGTQNWIYNITGCEVKSLYKPWYYNDSVYAVQQGGYLTQFNGRLSFATVHHAGHEVPAYQPEPAFELFRMYLSGSVFHNDVSTVEETNYKSSGTFPDVLSEVIAIILLVLGGLGLLFGCTEYYRALQKKKGMSESENEDN